MVLRMPSIQPPMETSTIVSAGSTRCAPTSPMKSQVNPGSSPSVKAWRMGNQPSTTPNRYRAPIASQKYGNEPMKTRSGGRAESRTPPRRQAARMPSRLPMTAAMTSAVPPSRRVQPIWLAMTSVTGVGKREMETPICAGEDVVQVVEVLLPEGPVVDAEQLAQGLDLFGLHSVLGAGEHA